MIYSLREMQLIDKDINNLIIQASTVDGKDGWQSFPIGMQFSFINNYIKEIQIGKHENTVLCAVRINTDKHRRGTLPINREFIINNLKQNNINNENLKSNIYFESLPKYKFVISPEGNGIDCHRHYEALIAGCIPIIEYNEKIEEKYKGCPILFTKDYSEITEEYLLKKYEEMIDVKYDYSRLFLSYYNINKQENIKKCGNYWMKKMTGKIWYR
jgi:hypothetical protein